MGVKSSVMAAFNVLKQYGFKTFVAQTVRKFKPHHFEKAQFFLEREQTRPIPYFSGEKAGKKGLVSVVIPCYNHERFIAKALDSIYNQTYEKIELIVVDDCSRDNSVGIIRSKFDEWGTGNRFDGLTFIAHEQNKGAHYSIDEAIGAGSGEFFAVLNSDDYYDYNRFTVLIEALENKKAVIGFSRVSVVDGNGNIKKRSPFEDIQKRIDQNHMFLGLCTDNLAISSGNLIFRRLLIQEIGLFRDFQYIHDWDFLMRAALTGEVVYCSDTTYYYRMHDTNSYLALRGNTQLCDAEMTEMRLRVFKGVYGKQNSERYSKEDYPKIIDLLYRRLVNSTEGIL